MQHTTPEPPPNQPWENGWVPDTSRAPGTRRLWLAGALAMATIVACVTAIVVMDNAPAGPSQASGDPSSGGTATVPGLISFATPSKSGAETPAGKSGLSSAKPTKSSAPGPQLSESPTAKESKSPTAHASPSKHPKPSATWRSVRSVNDPDRYWHASGGLVDLDVPRGSESRADSTFAVVKGLANPSCYTFKTNDGKYLRHRDFILRAERNDGSTLFKQDATFCPGYSGVSGAVLLQSVNYPNYALRHENFQLRLDPYGYNTTNRPDFYFRVVDPLG